MTASSVDSWHRLLAQKGLPGAGCFKAMYPSAVWNSIPCSAPPPHPWLPVSFSRNSKLALTVGDGSDFTADTKPKLISTAIGAFPKIKDVKSEYSKGGGFPGVNSYSLQLNSNIFKTSACGDIPHCAGWEQFIFQNPPGSQGSWMGIQDFLVPTEGSSLSGCPPSKGWQYLGIYCFQASPYGVRLPSVSITVLNELVETGNASSSGDSAYLSVGSTEYGMKNLQTDGITDLAKHWKGAEFNVFGTGSLEIAEFNKGAKITVSLQTDTGATTAPKCPADSGTTGESNNLYFVSAPKKPPKLQYPSIEFTMSSNSNGKASCDTVSAK